MPRPSALRSPVPALIFVVPLLIAACAGSAGSSPADPVSPLPSPQPSPTLDVAFDPGTTADPAAELCQDIDEMQQRLEELQAVELRLVNSVALDVAHDRLTATFEQIAALDLGRHEDELSSSLTRLGYRMQELDLGVEDFHTSTRPRRAAPHVEEAAQKVADELATLTILARC